MTIKENSSVFYVIRICHGKGTRAVKLCSNKILQNWVSANTG